MPEAENHSARDDDLLENACSLDIEDPTCFAEAFEDGLKPIDFATPEIAATWSAEIERRAQSCERGEMPTTEWRDAMARLRAHCNRSC